MSEKYLKRAAGDGRLAVLPEWLREGCTVWYWRETFCGDEPCIRADPLCPLNWLEWNDPQVIDCARRHPRLEQTQVWSVMVMFTRSGMQWVINDLAPVDDRYMRVVFFPSEKEARKHRPQEVVYG